ncbi:serine/threonine-protein phosphatase 6 catalytic subunit-like, partial [Pempheris klunzingeri]|uniref:serine/threonine-protein phosphatase 6 catalytic subunit-like n=1 Tax=Pempheris klunzingeri TaxID=3127111 RepID=UPI00397F6888
ILIEEPNIIYTSSPITVCGDVHGQFYDVEELFRFRYPNHIHLIRGNHESRGITQSYGFYDECIRKYGNANPWKFCCELFDLLSIAAVIDNSVFCVHGGLSPYLNTLEMIQLIERKTEVPNRGGFCDLLWSDPEEINCWELSPRGAGWLFGEIATFNFLHTNNISLVCRAHQLVNEGYKFMFEEKLVTVWSAPNYCYRCGNIASILKFDSAT